MKRAEKAALLDATKLIVDELEKIRHENNHPFWREQKMDIALMKAKAQLRKNGVEI